MNWILNHLQLEGLILWKEILLLVWFFVLVFLRGMLHSWHWATKRGEVSLKAGKFIRDYAEPHFNVVLLTISTYCMLYLLGVHLVGLFGLALAAWAVFDGLIDVGLGKGFFAKHVTEKWDIWFRGRIVLTVPIWSWSKSWRIAVGAVLVFCRFWLF